MQNFTGTASRYGLMLGGLAFVVFMLIYFLGGDPLGTPGLLISLLVLIAIPWSMVKVRDISGGGYMTYGRTLFAGVLVTLNYAVALSLLVVLFLQFISPEILEHHIEEQKENIIKVESIFGREQVEAMVEEFDNMTPGRYGWSSLLNRLIGGVIVSLIAAIFIKRKPSPFEATADE